MMYMRINIWEQGHRRDEFVLFLLVSDLKYFKSQVLIIVM